ncbi:MarR family transcriptional regulator [Mycobacterium sp. IEC1808]|uniref:MarR family winged helix-turn-helix transcriptional regulator n=1 Tax=Mycobacterium sp. IEC1808 TaxID=1743230 RepID=UPI001302DDBE|nr:MarR family transcriptional regulator [Mycobacterium sp. IEC1808]
MDEYAQALDVVNLLHRLSRSLADDIREHVKGAADLGISEFFMLWEITSGTATAGDISRALSSHPAATSRALTQLAREGYIDRRPDLSDSRRNVVTLTEHGQRVVDQIASRIRPRLQQRMDRLAPGQAASLITALQTLLDESGTHD